MQSRGMMRGGPGMCRMGSRGGGGRRAAHFHPFQGPPRGPFSGGEFMPLFRLLDDFTPFAGPSRGDIEIDNFFGPPQHPHPHHHGHHHGPHARHHRGGPRFELFPFGLSNGSRHEVFNPRFDVKETETSYELRGELPGVDPKDIEVAFSDAQTLIIKGRTERESSSGNQPTAADTAAAINDTPATETANANDDAVSETGSTFSTSSYQQPTVEDEPEEGATTTAAEKAPATETEQQVAEQQPQPEEQQQQQQQQAREHYWVSERSTGSFSRTFDFPARVNQEGVTASLRNGILELSVPKDVQSYARRINVE